MDYGIAVLVVYTFIAICVGFFINMLIIDIDDVEDDFDNDKVRYIAVILLSMFWIITIPVMLYNSSKN